MIRPFQPTVVRGFSKYTRITISRSAFRRSRSACSRCAYSSAAAGSWIEQGPTTTTSRSSMPCRMRWIAERASKTVLEAASSHGNSRSRCAGGASSLISLIRRSSVMCRIARAPSMVGPSLPAPPWQKKPPGISAWRLVSVLPLLRASRDSFRQWPEKAEEVEREEGSEARHDDATVPHAGSTRQVEPPAFTRTGGAACRRRPRPRAGHRRRPSTGTAAAKRSSARRARRAESRLPSSPAGGRA